jgi:organic hydroperoxide reductase OsmC/OhrA
MAEYTAELLWERGEDDFLSGRYSRRHRLRFDGGAEFAGSSSPHVVPLPMSDAAAIDPEEAFVAALASCHMLFVLAIAARRGFAVERYRDTPVGTMATNAEGRMAMTRVVLRPVIDFAANTRPSQIELESMHHRAHEQCYIANSVKTEVCCEAQVLAP